jgi:4a-hydroxytetrahydrobiopterin dehydratase
MKPIHTRAQLVARKSRPIIGERPYTEQEIAAQLASLPGWGFDSGSLHRSFVFRDYHETIAFVNAVAWVVHAEDHHPDLKVEYNRCEVRWHTHSASGITENDFICAAKTDAVFARNGS